MKEYGQNDGPLGKVPDNMSIGASDTVLLAVSFAGFCMLAWSIYSIVLAKLKTAQELQQEAEEREISYDERLAKADVSTLNRGQRRARAKHIMKQQRRLAGADGEMIDDPLHQEQQLVLLQQQQDHDENVPAFHGDSHHANTQHLLSRKERQKAAKQVELQERKLLEEDRRDEQKKAQEAAKARRKAKELHKTLRTEREKKERREQQQAVELSNYRAWKIFLETERSISNNNNESDDDDGDSRSNAITVLEWIGELKQNRIMYLSDLADRFEVDESAVRDRIQELLDTSRLSGILEKDGDENSSSARFIYICPNEMSKLASFVKSQDQIITPLGFARHIEEQLQPKLQQELPCAE
jgi:hypothetical protein